MNLLKLARSYATKIKQASVNNYKALLDINDKASAAAIDVYGDLSPEELKSLKELAKSINILTDNAYRKGVSATEIKYIIEKAFNQLKKIYIDSSTSASTRSDLAKLSAALVKVQYVDIPAQMQQIPPPPAPKPSDQIASGEGNAATKKSVDMPEIEQLQQQKPEQEHYVDYFNPAP